MSAKDVPSFDDLAPVEISSDDDNDDEIVTLNPGESIVGELRAVRHEVGKYDNTLLTIARGIGDTVSMWSCTSVNRQLDAAGLGPGDVVGIKKGDEKQSFDNDAGESVEFYPYEVRRL